MPRRLPVQQEVDDFLTFCRIERRLADLTCSAYERDVKACVAFLRSRGIYDAAAVKPPDLRAFLADEASRRPAVSSHGTDRSPWRAMRRCK